MAWIFIISMIAATFGGPFSVTFETVSLEACKSLRKVVRRELETMNMKYTLSECAPKEQGAQKDTP